MLSAEVERPHTEETDSQTAECIHCGLPTPSASRDDSGVGPFCCHGCEIAHAILQEDEELQEVWKQRTRSQPSATYAEMDHELFQDRYVTHLDDGLARVEFALENMVCASCVFAIEKLPRFHPGILQARVNLTTGRVTIEWFWEQLPLSEIAGTLHRLGYPPHPIDDDKLTSIDRAENRRRLVNLAVAGFCAGNAMLFAIAMYYGLFSGIAPEYANLFRWTSALLAVVSLSWPGATFFQNAWRAIRTRTPHMDLPVALGLSAGAALGLMNTLLGRGEIYFDSITVLVFLLLVGRYLQYQQQRKAIRQVSLLNSLTPASVSRYTNFLFNRDDVEIVPREAVRIGDILQVRIGDLIPVDGQILEGTSTVNCAILTGESKGQRVQPGDAVAAGTTNLSAPLILRVEKPVAETRLAEITRLVEAGIESKTPIVQFANSIAGYFVGVVIFLAVVTFLLWAPQSVELAVNHAMALLIVACPCALGLATPFTIAIAQARAARNQILIKSGDVLEKLRHSGTLWLDKTGTVTTGQLQIVDWVGDRDVIPVLVALEKHSIHPIAQAITDDSGLKKLVYELPDMTDVETVSGRGMAGWLEGAYYIVGSMELIESHHMECPDKLNDARLRFQSEGWTSILVAVDDQVVAVIALGDQIRPDARQTIGELQERGWKIGLLSGDQDGVVKHVAGQVGIDSRLAVSQISPEEKLRLVQEIAPEETVIMVGDGVNDSAALAASSVGIAVEGGAAVSLQAADVYMAQPGLRGIVNLITGARQTVRTIHLNFAVSLCYNLVAAGLAMSGLINPIIAAILMPVSSLTVLSIAFLNPAFSRGQP